MILGDVILRNAWLHRQDEAVIFENRRLTWGDYAQRVFRLANALVGMGIDRGDRVAILSRNCPEYLEVYGTGELCGWATVTVNFRLSEPEIAYILGDSRPSLLIYDAEYADVAQSVLAKVPSIERTLSLGAEYESALAAASAEQPTLRATPEDVAYLIYTSGTTGRPKGVVLSQAGQVAAAQIMSADHRTEPTDRYGVVMPLYHIGAKLMWMAASWRGCPVVLHKAWSPRAFADSVATERITGSLLAPTMLSDLLDLVEREPTDLSSLSKLFYSAAPMPTPLLRRGIARFGNIFAQFYGMTETGGPTSTFHPHLHVLDGAPEAVRRLRSAGQPSPRCDVRIVRPDGSDCAVDETGEIIVRSPALMVGYWDKPEATAETLQDGWLHTGDVGVFDEAGFLFIVDRMKDMIVSGGENIYSREVEEALAAHPDVADVAVVGRPDPRWGELVVAFVVPRKDATPTAEAIIAHCRTLIASYKKPSAVYFVSELPRLPNGKIEKPKLRARLQELANQKH